MKLTTRRIGICALFLVAALLAIFFHPESSDTQDAATQSSSAPTKN